MKKFIFLITLFLFANFVHADKKYFIPEITIKAQVLGNGDMKIEEKRTFDFRGKFSWADYNLPLQGIEDIEDFSIRENNTVYAKNDSEEPGTFYSEKTRDYFYARWFYNARNERRTFILSYTVKNVVNVYNDIAELYYKFLGDERPKDVGFVKVEIDLPGEEFSPDVKAWAHGALWSFIENKGNKVVMWIENLPRRNYFEARVLLPREWMFQSAKQIDREMLPQILEEEKQWAEEANRLRAQIVEEQKRKAELADQLTPISLILVVIAFIVFMVLFIKHGTGFKINYNQTIDPNIPREKHPALLNAIYFNNYPSGSTLSTTLFELARNGYLKMEQKDTSDKKWYQSKSDFVEFTLDRSKWENEKNSLLDFENDLLDFLFNSIVSGQNRITVKEMKKKSSKMQKWYKNWSKLVKSHLGKYYDKQSIKAAIISAIVSFLVAICGIVFLIIANPLPGVIGLVGGLILTFVSFSIMRYTAETKEYRFKLTALRKYLKKFPSSYSSDFNIGEYFVMAIALGLSQKNITHIVATVPESHQITYFPWFIYGTAGHIPATDFASAVSSVASAAGGAVSSASGAGGAGSAGGGGGAGGASGGAG